MNERVTILGFQTSPLGSAKRPRTGQADLPHPGEPDDIAFPQAREGRSRVMIEGVSPEIDGGRYPIKRVVGEKVKVEADIFVDGHDLIAAVLKVRQAGEGDWTDVPMTLRVNDRWEGTFEVTRMGEARYTIEAWVDRFQSWCQEIAKKVKADLDVSVELLAGAVLLETTSSRAPPGDASRLAECATKMRAGDVSNIKARAALALDGEIGRLMAKYSDRRFATLYPRALRIVVDRPLARFGSWYEMFPRSCPGRAGGHGTFRDVEAHLSRIAELGFDILYLPPIHPIGVTQRKGRNNSSVCGPDDPGSPWGIGSIEGGHKSVHLQLGTLDDFVRLVAKARELSIEIALDIAYQCSPDHPYVRQRTEWFQRRPDGSIQYAENPPKKYQDIFPLHFETDAWEGLWQELKGILAFWIDCGVTVFRVDNPHTKSFAFWEWVISEIKAIHPEVIFLSEAFTRPKLMLSLAKLGFSQSYNYFPWRNTKSELTQYFTELRQPALREVLRSNLWPNTPDILTQYLQHGGRPAFIIRLILAATLGASYGIYGPPFELCAGHPREPGSEEYLDSEKYEIKSWDLNAPGNLCEIVRRVNRVRRENRALQSDLALTFHITDNDQVLAYSKHTEDFDNIILVVVNLDPHHRQSGWIDLALAEFGMDPIGSYQVHDLLTDARFLWQGRRNYLELDPAFAPAHIFRLRQWQRSERDFDYYL